MASTSTTSDGSDEALRHRRTPSFSSTNVPGGSDSSFTDPTTEQVKTSGMEADRRSPRAEKLADQTGVGAQRRWSGTTEVRAWGSGGADGFHAKLVRKRPGAARQTAGHLRRAQSAEDAAFGSFVSSNDSPATQRTDLDHPVEEIPAARDSVAREPSCPTLGDMTTLQLSALLDASSEEADYALEENLIPLPLTPKAYLEDSFTEGEDQVALLEGATSTEEPLGGVGDERSDHALDITANAEYPPLNPTDYAQASTNLTEELAIEDREERALSVPESAPVGGVGDVDGMDAVSLHHASMDNFPQQDTIDTTTSGQQSPESPQIDAATGEPQHLEQDDGDFRGAARHTSGADRYTPLPPLHGVEFFCLPLFHVFRTDRIQLTRRFLRHRANDDSLSSFKVALLAVRLFGHVAAAYLALALALLAFAPIPYLFWDRWFPFLGPWHPGRLCPSFLAPPWFFAPVPWSQAISWLTYWSRIWLGLCWASVMRTTTTATTPANDPCPTNVLATCSLSGNQTTALSPSDLETLSPALLLQSVREAVNHFSTAQFSPADNPPQGPFDDLDRLFANGISELQALSVPAAGANDPTILGLAATTAEKKYWWLRGAAAALGERLQSEFLLPRSATSGFIVGEGEDDDTLEQWRACVRDAGEVVRAAAARV